MTLRLRPWLGLVAVLAVARPALAQAVLLSETAAPGDHFRYEIALTVEGTMTVDRDGKPDALPLKATASHAFVERVEAAGDRGGVVRAVRHYATASSDAAVGGERSRRELSADRRLIVAQRGAAGTLHYSPAGPLFRDELDLVAEHFDTLALAGLLPGREVKPGDTWDVSPGTAQSVCLFDGLVRSDLKGTFGEVKDGAALFTITGTAEGVENGAPAKLTITARGTFDLAVKRVTALTWEQADQREQGPATPATEVKAVVTLKRTALPGEPPDLSAAARAKVPPGDTVADRLTHLRYADPAGRYQLTYPRDWLIVGVTADHLVLRSVDAGGFAAQATVTAWKKADPGRHTDPDDFKKVLGQLPGWEPERVLADGPVPADGGRWLYRVAATGKQDGQPVVQSFLLLAGPAGDQAAVTLLAPAERVGRLAGRDLGLANGIEFAGTR